jgi:hypothetical protein
MTVSVEANAQPPSVSPFKRVLHVLTNRGQLSPNSKQVVLDGSALDTEEEDDSPSTPRPTPSPRPSPRLSPLPSQSAGSKSGGVSPRLGIVGKAVSLARRASSSGGIRKWQPNEKGRSLSLASAIPALSRTETARLQSLLFSPSDNLPHVQNDPFIEITTHSSSPAPLSSPQEAPTLSDLNIPLVSLPVPSSPMITPSLTLVADERITTGNPVVQCASTADITVPDLLQRGTPMIKVSGRKQKNVIVRLDPDQGQIIWESKKHRISESLLVRPHPHLFIHSFTVPIENIRELRIASDARHYRELFQISQELENRWLTIIYTLDGRWKIWHVIAPSVVVFQMWDSTLRELYAIRQTLMRGLGNFNLREAVWAKQYWKAADEQADQKLYFEGVKKLCKRLNVNSSRDDLFHRFKARVPSLSSFAMANDLLSKPIRKIAGTWILTTLSASSSCSKRDQK